MINDADFLLEPVRTKIHIRVQQRNGRKSWTIIEGIMEDHEVILRQMRKKLCVGGSLVRDEELVIIQLQGDVRSAAAGILRDRAIDAEIFTHGS